MSDRRSRNSNTGECILRRRSLLIVTITFAISSPALVMGQSETATHSRAEVRHTFPLSHFYDTPNPLPPGKPGELIRKEEFDEYDLSPSVSVMRILYHSRSADGHDVASSGVVLYPERTPPPGGWPVIAWAHDLNGISRLCAPSLSRNLQHGPLLSMYVNLGYAVVATDYTGLGTAFPNAFSDMGSNASDVIYSLPAAHAALPQLGSRWVAIGTGDGTRAVVTVARLEFQLRDPDYLGAIALGDLADLHERYQQPDLDSLIFLVYGTKTVFPDFKLSDTLTAEGHALLLQLEAACGGLRSQSKINDLIKADWQNNHPVQEYFAQNRLGEKATYGPILAITSEPDANGPASKIFARMCAQGDRVELDRYEVADPGDIIGDSVRAQIAWIQDRFAARSAPTNCPVRH